VLSEEGGNKDDLGRFYDLQTPYFRVFIRNLGDRESTLRGVILSGR